MRQRSYSLRRRVIAALVASVLATSAVFGLTTFIFAYTLEDRLFSTALDSEIARQQQSWSRDGTLTTPEVAYIKIYPGKAGLPADLAPRVAANPQQREFYGAAGRHYHVEHFTLDQRTGAASGGTPAVAVAEVSRYLLVRPVRDGMIQFLIALGLFVALAMALLGWWLANRAMRPLSRLAKDVADGGSETVPVVRTEDYPANEIGLLAGALGQAFQRIRGFVDRERSFTRDASHELRTPLAVIRGAAEVIAQRGDLPAPVPEALRRIETATIDMTQTLDLLLALAREGDALPVESIKLRPVVEKAIAAAAVRFPANRLAVSNDVAGDATIIVEPTSLQLVLNNLIGNTFQHAAAANLHVAFSGDQLSICDDGPGLGTATDAFAPFVKGEASEGSGLGLDIVRRLCAAAGIDLSSGAGANGQGACFTLKFADR
ncbi:MAG: HAMP domain-containing histidine kinase [Alphaproteobacteria bacterium]|nr:HAMP domain-containing histidine kinase [Alphaproteobacteria bacterium]MBU0864470.1 HAMP domain-containing histidine kinase [Alphaproteobacteria bacterium]MBU1823606.1 HAMP domain-containing histidine kinase [Alphaproteobacteria bacterium]